MSSSSLEHFLAITQEHPKTCNTERWMNAAFSQHYGKDTPIDSGSLRTLHGMYWPTAADRKAAAKKYADKHEVKRIIESLNQMAADKNISIVPKGAVAVDTKH